MALSLLAGPFDIVRGVSKTPSGVDITGWWPGVGLVARDPYVGSGILTLDGVFQGFSDVNLGTVGWWLGANKMLQLDAEDHQEYVLEQKTFIRLGKVPEDAVESIGNFYVKLNGVRYIATGAIFNHWVHSVVEGVVTPISEEAPMYYLTLRGQGRNEHELFVVGADVSFSGHRWCCCFYDLESNTFGTWMYPDISNSGLYYATDLGVIVQWCYPSTLRVLSTEVKPFSLSVPELYAGESKGGRLATYRVRAAGDLGEACVGELIDWTHSGGGLLLQSQSKTDEDGYATTRVRYGLSDSGYSEVKASLTC